MQIALFLKKFQNLIHDKEISKKKICEVLNHHLQKDFFIEEIKVSKGILYINKDIFIKNALLFKKQKIIDDLNIIQDKKIKDIQ